jgi:hypothetical protein
MELVATLIHVFAIQITLERIVVFLLALEYLLITQQFVVEKEIVLHQVFVNAILFMLQIIACFLLAMELDLTT